ncbi:MAG: hypothetical protein DHS20C01_33070 [marine bacterium B5-7]|nr:MAG: hypothetical protein DHS20C01_33070 [marine bacterium B5-7]
MSNNAPAHFAGELNERFEHASRRARQVVEFNFNVAGMIVRLCFAGEALVPAICRALDHLKTDATDKPALTINLWDTVSTHTPMLPAPFGIESYGPHGTISGYCNESYQTVYDTNYGILMMLDYSAKRAFWWTRDAAHLPAHEKASPLRTLLHLWTRPMNCSLLHAGAVGNADGGVLLVGRGGMGKSGTALACLAAGMDYVSDDFCILRDDPEPRAFSLYSTAKAGDATLQRIPVLKSMRDSPAEFAPHRQEDEKEVFFLHEHVPSRIVDQLPITAIVMPQVNDGAMSMLSPVSASFMTTHVGPNTLFMLPNSDVSTISIFANVARKLPCYRLLVGSDPTPIADTVASLLPTPHKRTELK